MQLPTCWLACSVAGLDVSHFFSQVDGMLASSGLLTLRCGQVADQRPSIKVPLMTGIGSHSGVIPGQNSWPWLPILTVASHGL